MKKKGLRRFKIYKNTSFFWLMSLINEKILKFTL